MMRSSLASPLSDSDPARALGRGLLCLLLLLTTLGWARADDPFAKKVVCTYHAKDFAEVAADLGKQAGLEMLVDSTIREPITIDLGSVTLGEALHATCNLAGVFFGLASDTSIAIAPADPKRPLFPLISETKVLPIRYITTKQLLSLMAVSPYHDLIAADDVSNRIRIIGPPALLERIEAEIAEIDRPKAQISAHAEFLDTSRVTQRDWSSAWQAGGSAAADNGGLRTFQFDGTVLGFSDSRVGNALFKLLNTAGKGKLTILSHPNLTVQDGEQAKIFVGGKSYYPVTATAGAGPVQVQPIDAGTTLQVTPKLVDKDQIEVHLHAEDSEVAATGIQGYPNVNSRTVDTVLTVRDGETIIIGGLADTLDYRAKSGVPVLSSLPLVGNLFRSSHQAKQQEEVTILLTMHVLHPGEADAQPAPPERASAATPPAPK